MPTLERGGWGFSPERERRWKGSPLPEKEAWNRKFHPNILDSPDTCMPEAEVMLPTNFNGSKYNKNQFKMRSVPS